MEEKLDIPLLIKESKLEVNKKKKLCKEHFKVGLATLEKLGPSPDMHKNE